MADDVDRGWLEAFLLELLGAATEVPEGETEILPGDARIVGAVERVLLPSIVDLGPDEIRRHAAGDVAARFGPDREDGLLLQTYIVSQHANLMTDPHAARIVDGEGYGLAPGPHALGQGATQNKGPMASAFAAVRAARRGDGRPVWLCVNTEGKSSHDGSRRILDDLGVRAAFGIVAFGTDLRVSLGNRGRVDVHVVARGRSSHSSQPWLGSNPIEAVADVIVALRDMPRAESHPTLGPVSVTPYQLTCHPVAPHTVPETARIVVDRRLLPGESPEEAVETLRTHLGDSVSGADLDVSAGVAMLPAVVDEGALVVRALLDGLASTGARAPETFWSMNAFDAGYACSRGIPTPMFGPGKRGFAGAGLVGTDLVSVHDCQVAAEAIANAIDVLCS
jgi:acetylornithine deacetylase/succinyl-diaminopimelate desuccinylase-like protein